MAAMPATVSSAPTRLELAPFAFQGRHRKAAPAPSSNPLDRVNVDRYRKLTRSEVNVLEAASHHVSTITPTDAARIDRPVLADPPPRRVNNTKAIGQIKYHCSSTARLHRWRSGEKLPKYCAPPRICPQLAK